MKSFEVTIIHAAGRTVRHVIARSGAAALQVAAAMLPELPAQFAVICKPSGMRP